MPKIILEGQEAIDYMNMLQSSIQPTVAEITTTHAHPTPFDEPTPSVDSKWRELINSLRPDEYTPSRKHVRFDTDERNVIANAADKSDPHYYSVSAISRGTGRTLAAIRTEANKQGFSISNGSIISVSR